MKRANRPVNLSSAMQSTYARVQLPTNYARAGSLPACGHEIVFVCWMTCGRESRRLAPRLEDRISLRRDMRNRVIRKGKWESTCPIFGSVTGQQNSLESGFGAAELHSCGACVGYVP